MVESDSRHFAYLSARSPPFLHIRMSNTQVVSCVAVSRGMKHRSYELQLGDG